jgi:hypothetical protein
VPLPAAIIIARMNHTSLADEILYDTHFVYLFYAKPRKAVSVDDYALLISVLKIWRDLPAG